MTQTTDRIANNQTQHTLGPWQNCKDGIYTPDGFDCIVEARHIGGNSDAQARANTRLIAASPELLEAARLVEARSHINADGSYTVDASAMDAICKVLGKFIRRAKAERRVQ